MLLQEPMLLAWSRWQGSLLTPDLATHLPFFSIYPTLEYVLSTGITGSTERNNMQQNPNLVNRRLGNYLLTQGLGKGGFAEVYLGEHIHLKTQVAVKVLLTQLTQEAVETGVNPFCRTQRKSTSGE
jgi:hypothetical protein